MKLNQIIGSQESLAKLLELKIPIKVSYKVSKLINKIQPDLKIYEEKRMDLFKEYGVLDEEKQVYNLKPENIEKFSEDLKTLLDTDIDMSFGEGKELEKIKINDLSGEIEPKYLIALDWLIE